MFIDVRKVYGANDTRSTFSFSLQLSENSAKLIEHEIILCAGVNYIVCRYAVCIYTLCRAGTGSGGGQCNHFAAMLGWWCNPSDVDTRSLRAIVRTAALTTPLPMVNTHVLRTQGWWGSL